MSKRLKGFVAIVTVQGAMTPDRASLFKQFFQLLHHGHGSGCPAHCMTHVAARCSAFAVRTPQMRQT